MHAIALISLIQLVLQAAPAQPSILPQLLMLVPIGLIFYLLLIRPQRKRQKEHEAMISDLGNGDKIVTNGGLFGTITKVEEKTFRVRLGQGVEVTILRSHIAAKAGEGA